MKSILKMLKDERGFVVSSAIATIATGLASWAGVGLSATAAGAIGAAGAGAAYGIGATALAGGMGGGKSSMPSIQMPGMPSAPKIEDASKNAKLRADERKRAMARSDSIMTNPLGLKDEANVVRKKLLGG